MTPLPLDGRLHGLKAATQGRSPEAAREVARQFEALFARQMLSGLQATAKVPGSGVEDLGPMQSIMDQQLGALLTRGSGLGLAEQLMRQWQQLGQLGEAAPTNDAHRLPTLGTAPTRTVGSAASAAAPRTSVDAADATSAGLGDRVRQFVRELLPMAREAASQLGVAPQAIIAQAALETGFGRHQPGGSSNNLFGIKAFASWQGARVTADTTEVRDGRVQRESAAFRAYDSVSEGVRDYVALLKRPRYTAARNTGSDVTAFARGLQQGGYATDPDYASKITRIADRLVREGLVR